MNDDSPQKSNYLDKKAGEDLDTIDEIADDASVVPKELMDDYNGGLSCWQTFLFFVKHSYRDVSRRKCHFCLALCSVMIVVLSTLVVNTVISKGPIIFMKLAQAESGEIDCMYTPKNDKHDNSNYFWNDIWSLNYTQALQVLDEHNVEHHISPRYQMCPFANQMQFTDTEGIELASNGTMCIKFIDTE